MISLKTLLITIFFILLKVIILEDYFFKSSRESDNQTPPEAFDLESSVEKYTSETGHDENFYSLSDALIIYTSGTTGPPKGT